MIKKKNEYKKYKAFTIIEIITVIAIIMLMVSMAYIVHHKAIITSQDILCINNHRILAAGIIAYAIDHGRKFPKNEGGRQGYLGWGSLYFDGKEGVRGFQDFKDWRELFDSYVDFQATKDPSLQTTENKPYAKETATRLMVVIVCGEIEDDSQKLWEKWKNITSERLNTFSESNNKKISWKDCVLTTCIAGSMDIEDPDQDNILYYYGKDGNKEFANRKNYLGAHQGKWVNTSFADGRVEKFYVKGGNLYKNKEKNKVENGGSFYYAHELGFWVGCKK